MTQNIEQKISKTQDKLARLKQDQKASEAREKIIVGAVTISSSLKEQQKAFTLAMLLRQTVTQETDRMEIVSLLEKLANVAIEGERG